MNPLSIPRYRLYNQYISRPWPEKPGDFVAYMGAVQAQDYLGALWALGLRTPQAAEAEIEKATVDRTIVRTWPMRGTLHFVAPADARWMLELLTPRIIAASAGLYRRYELDHAVFARSSALFVQALQGGQQLTRNAMRQVLDAGGVSTANSRGLHIMGHLAQKGLICFGPRVGKQQTFVLLDEWIPNGKHMERNEALAEIARRYFMSHGPAALQDFVWWTGLTVTDAKVGLESVKTELVQEESNGQTYWFSPTLPALAEAKDASPTVHLLPAYDEYTVAYRDRSAIIDPAYGKRADSILSQTIVLNGQIVGNWKRTLQKGSVVITPHLFTSLTEAEHHTFNRAAQRYAAFLEMSVAVE
jgi:hypothetical protein